ncbi:MAG: hypothetical protein ABSD74_19290 [Rhizomicrobium sp.]|jgi:hypothetical protein
MSGSNFILVNGQHLLWADLVKERRRQQAARAKAKQPTLFELVDDTRPTAERTAAGRYLEPTLFAHPEREG